MPKNRKIKKSVRTGLNRTKLAVFSRFSVSIRLKSIKIEGACLIDGCRSFRIDENRTEPNRVCTCRSPIS